MVHVKLQDRNMENKVNVSDYKMGMKGVQYSSFQKQQLFPSNITAGLGQVLDVIGNGITRISDKGASVTDCDLEAQLEGCDTTEGYNILIL